MPDKIDEIEIRKKKAFYRANHRGTKEMDILLGRFAEEKLPNMSQDVLLNFENFLSVPDRDLESWIIRDEYESKGEFKQLILELRQFHGLAS